MFTLLKITTVLDSKPTKIVGHFERLSPIFVGMLKKDDLNLQFWTNVVNKRHLENKKEQCCAVRLFIFKVAETFCQFFQCRYFFFPVGGGTGVGAKDESFNMIGRVVANPEAQFAVVSALAM